MSRLLRRSSADAPVCLCRQTRRDTGNQGGGGRTAMRAKNRTRYGVFKETELPLEVVILMLGGLAMLITGLLLLPVSAGLLPYYANGLYGLLLVMFALQAISLGKTPFGDMKRSRPLLVAGVMVAAVGIVTCFIPVFGLIPRLLLFLCFAPGGLLLLLQMCLCKDKLRRWAGYGGIFRHLIASCSAVYVLSILTGLLVWNENLLTTPATAVAAMAFGMAILYLATVLRRIYAGHPEAQTLPAGDVALSTDQAMLMLTGVFMLLLGLLLVPVGLGLLPFSASAQLGLLMVIFAVQMLASGSTPIGPFPRSRLVIGCGLLFATLGIIACIVPGILVAALTVLVGVLNILGGILSLSKTWASRPRQPEGSRQPAPPVFARLFKAQSTMNLLTVMFGVSMLVPGLVATPVIGVILAANGCVLLYLLSILVVLDKSPDGTKKVV